VAAASLAAPHVIVGIERARKSCDMLLPHAPRSDMRTARRWTPRGAGAFAKAFWRAPP